MGFGFFNNPKQLTNLGLVQGIIYFILAMILTYYTFQILFEAVEFTQKSTFIEIVQSLLGEKIKKITNVTIIIDYSCSLIFYAIAAWEILMLLLDDFKVTQ